MSIDKLITEKDNFKTAVIDTMGIPLAKAYAVDAFMAAVIEVLTELKASVDVNDGKIDALDARVDALEERVEALEE